MYYKVQVEFINSDGVECTSVGGFLADDEFKAAEMATENLDDYFIKDVEIIGRYTNESREHLVVLACDARRKARVFS